MITNEQAQEMLSRLERNKTRGKPQAIPDDAVDDEIGLHGEIMRWLKTERVPYLHARTDKKSGIAKGAPDFVFPYRGKTFYIEVKTRTGKRSIDQLAWAMLAEHQGVIVRECRSMTEFHNILSPQVGQSPEAVGS